MAVTATILLITSELVSPRYGLTNMSIKRKRLKNVSLAISALFFATVAIRIIGIIYSL